ncbi:MAG: tetratricopeptide repeat protein [Acidobacteria bacterium]|nr:tetratricopeptide repeat protein [Acidobacteriota bacterium]
MTSATQTMREELSITRDEFTEMGRVGAMYYNQGNLDKARTIFEGLVELDPESPDARSALGAVFTLQKEDDMAVPHLKKAVELDPKGIAPYVNLAEVFIRQQRIEDAVVNLRKAIELDPEEVDSGANRARAMVLGIYQVIQLEDGQSPEIPLESDKIN